MKILENISIMFSRQTVCIDYACLVCIKSQLYSSFNRNTYWYSYLKWILGAFSNKDVFLLNVKHLKIHLWHIWLIHFKDIDVKKICYCKVHCKIDLIKIKSIQLQSCLSFSFRYDPKSDKVEMSKTTFKYGNLNILGKLSVTVFRMLFLLEVKEGVGEDNQYLECNNMTLINLVLKFCGPLHEKTLVTLLLSLQVKSFFFIM